ncbi:MAG TPA: hypothetical protein PKC18_20865, partial [Lacipirellulaceae bacterium]|nr:hypothetical protein [Lacipirellulaceae bacterium]
MSAPAERSPGAYPRAATREVAPRPSLGAAPVSSSRRSPAPCVRELPDGARILAGNAGDHPLVLQLLVETQQAALTEDFQSRLDEPSYRPSDRLLVQRHKSLVAHVRLAHHIGCFDGQRVPLVQLHDLVSLPQYGQAEYDCHLLEAAESIATDEGAVLGVVHAERPAPFQSAGWSLIRAQGHTRASARGVLAHLDAQEAARRRR